MRWAWEEGREGESRKRQMEWVSDGGLVGDREASVLYFSLKAPWKPQTHGTEFPSGRGGNASSENTHTHTQKGNWTLSHTKGSTKRGELWRSRQVNASTCRHAEAPEHHLNTSELYGNAGGPTFHGYWRYVGGDCRGIEVAGINLSPTCNLFKVDWQVPGTFPPFSCGAQSWCLVGKLG